MAKIKIVSTLNNADYKRGIKEMESKNSQFGNKLGGMSGKLKGAFGAAAVIALTAAIAKGAMALVNFGSKLTDMAAQSDVSVEKFQEYEVAVRNAGGESAALSNALIKIKAAQGDVLGGNMEFEQSFKILGISMEDIASMKTEELFEQIAKSVTESGNAALEYNAALEILGKRGGGKLIEALNEIGSASGVASEGLNKLSNADAQALDLVADKWEALKNSFKVTGARAVSALFGGGRSEEVQARLTAQTRQQEIAKQSRLKQAADLKTATAAEETKKIEEEKTKELEKQADIRDDIAKQIRTGREQIEKSVKIKIDTDQFRNIGGQAGGSVSVDLMNARRAIEIEMKQAELLKSIERNTREEGGLAP